MFLLDQLHNHFFSIYNSNSYLQIALSSCFSTSFNLDLVCLYIIILLPHSKHVILSLSWYSNLCATPGYKCIICTSACDEFLLLPFLWYTRVMRGLSIPPMSFTLCSRWKWGKLLVLKSNRYQVLLHGSNPFHWIRTSNKSWTFVAQPKPPKEQLVFPNHQSNMMAKVDCHKGANRLFKLRDKKYRVNAGMWRQS